MSEPPSGSVRTLLTSSFNPPNLLFLVPLFPQLIIFINLVDFRSFASLYFDFYSIIATYIVTRLSHMLSSLLPINSYQ